MKVRVYEVRVTLEHHYESRSQYGTQNIRKSLQQEEAKGIIDPWYGSSEGGFSIQPTTQTQFKNMMSSSILKKI